MELHTLRDLYVHELKDLYSAERQLVKALPKMAKAATNDQLRAGIEAHLEETVEHVNRLEALLESLGETTRGPKCAGMEGLIEEGSNLIGEKPDEEVLDAGLICGAQRIEHYEIAAYGCARTFAELLGEEEAVTILQSTLDEEIATDRKLTELAISTINLAAAGKPEGGESGNGNGARNARNGAKQQRATTTANKEEEDDDDEARNSKSDDDEEDEEEDSGTGTSKSSGSRKTARRKPAMA